MTVRTLQHTDFDSIVSCFLKAFENYYVAVPTNKAYYKHRWNMAKVDFALSYGMFDGNSLVGFIINAIDERQGQKIAFNTGTGVLPDYRGQNIVKSIYDIAIPDLQKHGVKNCSLEVIVENLRAIKSYKRIGFEICKTLHCFSGEIQLQSTDVIDLREVDHNKIDWKNMPNQNFYSWDFNSEVLKKGHYKYYQLFTDNSVESYFVINPDNHYLAQFEILKTNDSCWNRLFTGIKAVSNSIKIINVDSRLKEKIEFLYSIGLSNTINQYEMALALPS